MPAEIEFPITLVLRKVGPGAVSAEPLFFPEFARLGANRALAGAAARRNLSELIPQLNPSEFLRRRRADSARELTFTVDLAPPRINEAWRESLVLTFHAAVWACGAERTQADPAAVPLGPTAARAGQYTVARVAELGIDVIAEPGDDLVAVLRRETVAALRRLNLSTGLKPLALVQQTLGFAVERHALAVRVPSLKDRAVRAASDEQDGKKSLLQQVATPLGRDSERTYEVDDAVRELAEALTATPPQSVLLVGPSGAGKTAVVRELARRWRAAGKATIFQSSGSRVVAGQTGFGMWRSFTSARWSNCWRWARASTTAPASPPSSARPSPAASCCASPNARPSNCRWWRSRIRSCSTPSATSRWPSRTARAGAPSSPTSRATTRAAPPARPRSRPPTGCTAGTRPTPPTPAARCGSWRT
jgi:hypothetical protein